MAAPRFELYERAGWRWRLVDGYGHVVASGFRYASKANARRAAQKAKDAAKLAAIVDAVADVDVTAVAGAAFGVSVDITIGGMGNVKFPPTPSVSLPAGGGSPNKTAPKAKAGPGGLFVTCGLLQAGSKGEVGPAGSSTSTAAVADVDLLGETLTATSVSSTCAANETGVTGSTTLAGGMLVLDENQIVTLPSTPAPSTTYEGTNADTGDTFTVILNEQVAGADGITVHAVHIVLNGPTATGDIFVASTRAGVTTAPS